ncbi:unnamed protein product [Caenorhabditis auriculariae]|uniref:RRM domain-containing protein n=1 Tax=Caenorhabditis auriculariae TaxID=2777116 RepID=A0A8S1GQC1_9PELO|nr:unnamed protein product [Caenorhabditis auriculariae]
MVVPGEMKGIVRTSSTASTKRRMITIAARRVAIAATLKRSHPAEDFLQTLEDQEFAIVQAKKMMAASAVAPFHVGTSLSNGTTPNSLCSTPVTLFPQQPLLHLFPQHQLAQPHIDYQMQLQPTLANTYEGIPIFVVPSNGPTAVPLAAIQRAAEIKATLANIPHEPRIDTSQHYHVFVGDLSPEVDNRLLKESFAVHGEVSEAKVIRDAQTQKSKGYGFVSFPLKENAEQAITAMNGQWVGRRAIRTNWATRRPAEEARDKLTFEQIFNSTKPDNTSVYVGNVHPVTTENDLREFFTKHGEISEVRLFKAQGYAFVRYEKKECATTAIMEANGKELGGNTIRCSWGRVQPNNPPAQVMPDLTPLLAPALMQTPMTAMPNIFYNPYFTPPVCNTGLANRLFGNLPIWFVKLLRRVIR